MEPLRPIDKLLTWSTTRKEWNQSELARQLGISPQTLSNWKDRGAPPASYAKIADLMGISIDDLVRNTYDADRDTAYAVSKKGLRRIVVAGTARLGEDGYYEEISPVVGAGDGHIPHYSEDPNAYALRVKGSSMHPAIRDGWYVIVEPNGRLVVGEAVLVKLRNGQRMVKELLAERSDAVTVMSVNGSIRHTFERDEIEAIQPISAYISPSKWQPE